MLSHLLSSILLLVCIFKVAVAWSQKSRMSTNDFAWVQALKTRINSQSMRVSERLRTTLDAGLLANTETGEDTTQQIVRGEFTGDFAQRLLRKTQFFSQ